MYGLNDAKDKDELWKTIIKISGAIRGAWFIGGDFNNVLHMNERGGSAITLEEIAGFRNCVIDSGLEDHKSSGPFFTWSNKQEGEDRVFSKIDRVLANLFGGCCCSLSS